MPALDRILRNYDLFLEVLKFSLKNDDKLEFKDLLLVSNLNLVLNDLEQRLNTLFKKIVRNQPICYESLCYAIFKGELKEYKPYLNDNTKIALLKNFQLLIDLTHYAIDRSDSVEVEIIDKEIRNVKANLRPILKFIRTPIHRS